MIFFHQNLFLNLTKLRLIFWIEIQNNKVIALSFEILITINNN